MVCESLVLRFFPSRRRSSTAPSAVVGSTGPYTRGLGSWDVLREWGQLLDQLFVTGPLLLLHPLVDAPVEPHVDVDGVLQVPTDHVSVVRRVEEPVKPPAPGRECREADLTAREVLTALRLHVPDRPRSPLVVGRKGPRDRRLAPRTGSLEGWVRDERPWAGAIEGRPVRYRNVYRSHPTPLCPRRRTPTTLVSTPRPPSPPRRQPPCLLESSACLHRGPPYPRLFPRGCFTALSVVRGSFTEWRGGYVGFDRSRCPPGRRRGDRGHPGPTVVPVQGTRGTTPEGVE